MYTNNSNRIVFNLINYIELNFFIFTCKIVQYLKYKNRCFFYYEFMKFYFYVFK